MEKRKEHGFSFFFPDDIFANVLSAVTRPGSGDHSRGIEYSSGIIAGVGGSRGVYRRLYAFEAIVAAHALLIAYVARRDGFQLRNTFGAEILLHLATLLLQLAAGVTIRFAWETWQGRGSRFRVRIRTAGWLSDSARLLVAGSLTSSVYSAIKVAVPLYNARIFDQELWALDRLLFFGYSPNVFFLSLFSTPVALHFVDRTYASVFFVSLGIAVAFFLSHPSRRIRVAFMSGSAVLWLVGAWLYMFVPSLGPAFTFPEAWVPFREDFRTTASIQRMLFDNYRRVLSLRAGAHVPVSLMLGVGAFPSLHVGFQTFAFLWMRRLWAYGQLVFGIFTAMIFFGSIITGWHYLVDALAGIVLAIGAFTMWSIIYRTRRWTELRSAVAR